MNQRALGITLIALLSSCVVGSLVAGAFSVIDWVAAGVAAAPTRPEPAEEPSSTEPPVTPDAPKPAALPLDTAYAAPEVATAQYAVFHLDPARKDPWQTMKRLLKGSKWALYRDEVPDEAKAPYLVLRDLPIAEYPAPSVEDADWLTPVLKKAMPRARRATVIDAVLPPHDASLLELSKLMLALSQATGGVLWDQDSQDAFSQDEWKTRRVLSWQKTVPEVLRHYAVYADPQGDLVNLRTGGLTHFALPELVLDGAPLHAQPEAIALLNAVVQLLVESGASPQPGPMTVRLDAMKHRVHQQDCLDLATDDALKQVEILLVAKPDDDGPLLQITFPGGPQAGLVSLFGTQPAEEAP